VSRPNQQQFLPRSRTAPGQNAPINWNHNHEVYPNTVQQKDNGDPTIRQQKVRAVAPVRAAVQSAAHAVNPNDTNYGGILSQWHMQLVHDLLLSVEFWAYCARLVADAPPPPLRPLADASARSTANGHGRHSAPTHQHRNFARYHNLRVIKIHNRLCRASQRSNMSRELRENGDGPREIDQRDFARIAVPCAQRTDPQIQPPNSRPKHPGSERVPKR